MRRRRGPWVLLGVTIAALLAVVAFVIVSTVDPAITGTPGTAVITHCTRQRGHPFCYGSFRTDDGKINLGNAWIQGEDGASPGDRFTAYYTAHNHEVATSGSAEDIVYAVITIALLLAATIFQLWNLVVRPRRAAKRGAVTKQTS
ncbi:MAG TPA: hypothetical protein VGN81_20415 [Pseudonocardiaceae bacterium]